MKPTNLNGALTLLSERLIAEGKSEHTIRAYKTDVEMYVMWRFAFTWADAVARGDRHFLMNMVDVHDAGEAFTPSFYENLAIRYINETRGEAAPATTNRRMAAITKMCKVLLLAPPFTAYKGPTPKKGRAHPLPDGVADLTAMIAEARTDQARALLALCGMCGLRVSEARSIRERDFLVDGGEVLLTVRGKGDKERVVPVPKACLTLVTPLFGKQDSTLPLISLSDRYSRTVVTRLGSRAGVCRPVASHDLRMTYGTAIYEASKDLRVTQELLGHADSRTTERYTGIREDAMRTAVKEVFG